MTGIELIAAERQRQIECEGFDAKHDARYATEHRLVGMDEKPGRTLVAAALCYLETCHVEGEKPSSDPPYKWPWSRKWRKPDGGVKRNLVKAGALIAAELDRQDAIAARGNDG